MDSKQQVKRLVGELDAILAFLMVIAALVAGFLLIFLLPATTLRYIINVALLFVAGIAYLLLRKGKRLFTLDSSLLSGLQIKSSTFIILSILFFGFFSYSMLSIAFRPELYSRPLAYFIATVIMAGIVAIQILCLPNGNRFRNLTMMEIMLIFLSLVFSIQAITPGLVGIDPWWHEYITANILETGHTEIAGIYTAYENLPAFHLIIGSTSLMTDLSYKISTELSIGILQAISLVFVFLLGRLIFNSDKVGLLAALLAAIADKYIVLGFWTRPMTLGTILLPIILYVLLKGNQNRSVTYIFFAILLSASLILSHALAATIMALLLILFWILFIIYKKGYGTKSDTPAAFGFVMLFTVMMYSWWMYTSGHDNTFMQIITWGFIKPEWEFAGLIAPYMPHYLSEDLLNGLGFAAFIGLSFIGVFYMISKKYSNQHSFVLALSSTFLVGLVFLSLLGGKTAFYPGRWYPSLQILCAFPLAVAIFLLCGAFKNNILKVSIITLLIIFLSFFMLTSPQVNMDRSIYSDNTMTRYFLTESELAAAQTITNIHSGKLRTDDFYAPRFPGPERGAMKELTPQLVTGDYTDLGDMLLVIRKEIIGKPFFAETTIRIDYDPREVIADLHFPRIYDSGSVTAFLSQK